MLVGKEKFVMRTDYFDEASQWGCWGGEYEFLGGEGLWDTANSYDDVQGLGASDCKTQPSRCNIIPGDSRTDRTAQRTLVAE